MTCSLVHRRCAAPARSKSHFEMEIRRESAIFTNWPAWASDQTNRAFARATFSASRQGARWLTPSRSWAPRITALTAPSALLRVMSRKEVDDGYAYANPPQWPVSA